jgi:pilus assembly protein CpaE
MRVVLASEDSEHFEQLRQLAQGVGLECSAEDCVSHEGLRYRLAQSPRPDLVVVLTDPDEQKAQPAIEYAAAHGGVPVLAAGKSTDAQWHVQAVHSGARQYLNRDRLKDELTAAVDRLQREGAVKGRRGHSLAVTSVRPGMGVTTVATGVAFALGATAPGKVLLAEVGSGVPELALDLDLEVRHSVGELVKNWERSDARMVRQSVVEHPAGVCVLTHTPETLAPVVMDPTVMRHLAVLFRTLYDFAVLDLGHSGFGAALEAMKLSEVVVVVVEPTVPAMRMTLRYLGQLDQAGIAAGKVRLVANRYGQSGQVDWRKAEETLGRPVTEWVPEDPGTVNQAINEGRPLIQMARRAKITKTFDKLAQLLTAPAKVTK